MSGRFRYPHVPSRSTRIVVSEGVVTPAARLVKLDREHLPRPNCSYLLSSQVDLVFSINDMLELPFTEDRPA